MRRLGACPEGLHQVLACLKLPSMLFYFLLPLLKKEKGDNYNILWGVGVGRPPAPRSVVCPAVSYLGRH